MRIMVTRSSIRDYVNKGQQTLFVVLKIFEPPTVTTLSKGETDATKARARHGYIISAHLSFLRRK